MRRKPEGDYVKVRLENMHIRRRVNGFENENVISINNNLGEEREGEVGNIVDIDEKEKWSKNGSLRYIYWRRQEEWKRWHHSQRLVENG